MNLLVRCWRFCIVGVGGFAVQMISLALFHRICGPHYLLASAAALELTVLHNFFWHRRYTWRDRRSEPTFVQLARFHLSNGLVSLAGTLTIVHLLLVNNMHIGLRAANAVSVLCCAVANFALGNLWAFARRQNPGAGLLDASIRAECSGPTRT